MLFVEKYAPTTLNDLIIEPQLKKVIQHLITMNSLNLLLVGNVASGKTTLIKMIVQNYYGENQKNINDNILYINSGKDQGIQYCRTEVKTFCESFSSIPGKKKIIIVDEINQLSEPIQHLFRTYIDKYQSNVHFICSCISLQKVIENLQSRLIIIRKCSFNKEHLNEILHHIKQQENINIEPMAEEFILQLSNGTIKILINYLQMFKLLDKPITFTLARELCSNINFGLFENYNTFLKNRQLLEAIQIFTNLYASGISCIDIINNYYSFIIYTNLLTEPQKYEIIHIICEYIVVFNTIHEEEIELACFTNDIYISLFK